MYAWSENFVLPLSHDEVVHLKGSLLHKMPGDRWQQFANLRALFGWMWAHPGKQLVFMGGEFAQEREWSESRSLDWHLLDDRPARGVQSLMRSLNAVEAAEPALYAADFTPDGFRWIDANDSDQSVYSFLRFDPHGGGRPDRVRRQPHARAPARLPVGATDRRSLDRGAQHRRRRVRRRRRRQRRGLDRRRRVARPPAVRRAHAPAPRRRLARPPTDVGATSVICRLSLGSRWETFGSSFTGTSTNRRARTRGPKRSPRNLRPRRSTTGTSASPPSATGRTVGRVLDEHGRVTDIVNNYAHLSFNIGPTLMSWLETHCTDVYERILEADRERGGAMAQAYNHPILPLSNERDVRTQIRWGIADFEHRFGRRPAGLWLPETAVNDEVLRILVEEGVRFTILAPNQAVAVRALDDDEWIDVSDGSIATGPPHRWFHPDDHDRSIDLVFYDGPISHDLAFGLTGLSSQELVRRVVDAAADGTPVVVATDGETFGHHHKFADRALAYAFTHEASTAGVRVLNTAALVEEVPPTHEVRVRESAWSCAHGVRRWKEDCGCSTGGEPDWNQAWRAPLRQALDVLRPQHRGVRAARFGGAARSVGGARRLHRRDPRPPFDRRVPRRAPR